MDDTLNRILSLIKENRIQKGKFLSDLGFNRSTISDWINNKSESYLKYLPQIAEYFDVSIDWLAGKEQKNKPAAESDELTNKEKQIIELFRLVPLENRELVFGMIEAALRSQGLLK